MAASIGSDARDRFPVRAVDELRATELLVAVLPGTSGGAGLLSEDRIADLRDVLVGVGRASLVLGRIYEGHVNALTLILRYAEPAARQCLLDDARAGHLFGVWNTQSGADGLRGAGATADITLTGAKTFASGAGFVTRPLVTATMEDGRTRMVVPDLGEGERADLSDWRVHGMRGSASGRVDFTGLRVRPDRWVGEPDDYFRQPVLSCGAWRFLAVQCGGIEAVFEAHRSHLLRTGRGDDPHQRARLGRSATAVETARLFIAEAARAAARAETDPEGSVAFVNLARGAVEQAGLDVLHLAQRSVGLAGYHEDHPLEPLMRDLATYLRQPAPDLALANAAGHLLSSPLPLHAVWPGDQSR